MESTDNTFNRAMLLHVTIRPLILDLDQAEKMDRDPSELSDNTL
jgi:hypothetical protein